MNYFKDGFWKAAFVRAVRTAAQTAVSLIGVGATMSDVNWLRVASASALAGLLSILTSIATGLPEIDLPSVDAGGK